MSPGEKWTVALAIPTLIAAVLGTAIVWIEHQDRKRYVRFLIRISEEAADAKVRMTGYGSAVYPVTITEKDLDLAFRALAQDLIVYEGYWAARPMTFSKGEQVTADGGQLTAK